MSAGKARAGHTPGPWKVTKPPRHEFTVLDSENSGVCMVWGSDSEAEANALLIRRAPEMDALLRRCREGLAFVAEHDSLPLGKCGVNNFEEWRTSARALIADIDALVGDAPRDGGEKA